MGTVMKLPRRNFLQLAAGAAALPALSRAARAQTYPTRQITFIVPFPPPASPKATPVLAGVQQFTRVCTYDRPGTVGSGPEDFSRSDPVPMPRNAAAG